MKNYNYNLYSKTKLSDLKDIINMRLPKNVENKAKHLNTYKHIHTYKHLNYDIL